MHLTLYKGSSEIQIWALDVGNLRASQRIQLVSWASGGALAVTGSMVTPHGRSTQEPISLNLSISETKTFPSLTKLAYLKYISIYV